MQTNGHIYDIIAKLMMGSLSKEESDELDEWLAESPRHKQLMDSFLARTDMQRMFDIPAAHKDADEMFRGGKPMFRILGKPERMLHIFNNKVWTRIAAAAVIVMVAGAALWYEYVRVSVPDVSEQVMATMTMSQQSGRSDAEITIEGASVGNAAHKLATLTGVTNDAGLEQIYTDIQAKADIDMSRLSAHVVTRHDKEFWLTLPDGSRVHLNYGCHLTYPLSFTGENREVYLEGEAYFVVARDHRHPFIVHTKYGDVKEYGTEFDVNTNPTSGSKVNISVVLVKGSISVTPKGGAETMMEPNDMALLDGSAAAPEIRKVDVAPLISWNTGVFSFDDCEMEKLMMVFGKWYDLDVKFVDSYYEHIRFTGELDRYSDVHSAINAINNLTGMSICIEGKTLIVK